MTDLSTRLFDSELVCWIPRGVEYQIVRLTRKRALRWAEEIVEIHNDIPHLTWDADRLVADVSADSQTTYHAKWDMSLVAVRDDKPIGFLIAYLRSASTAHPAQSAYIHRLAVARDTRGQGIGSHLVGYFLEELFHRVRWLLTVTVQTNDEADNARVLRFYEDFGFRRVQRVRYPDKTDWLFELSRDDFRWRHRAGRAFERVHLPAASSWPPPVLMPSPFPTPAVDGEAPRLYFRTGSHEKREQYKYLLRCFGIELVVPRLSITVAEPQVEGVGPDPERELVTGPLKLMSRFAARASTFPLAVEDTMLFVEQFNNDFEARPLVPGPDTKRWWAALRDTGLVNAMAMSERRAARYVCQIGVLIDRGEYRQFRSEMNGRIAFEPRTAPAAISHFPYSNATFFHSVFVPEGSNRTLGEMDPEEFVIFDYRRRCVAGMMERADEIFIRATSSPQLF